MPGISTSLMPAPGSPVTTLFAPVIVIRSHVDLPDGTRSRWVAPVVMVLVTALPAAVVTRNWFAMDRAAESSSSRIPMLAGRLSEWLKLIWIHCPMGVAGSLSAQAVVGFPSKAFAGAYCIDSASHVPADEAVTLLAPDRTATV